LKTRLKKKLVRLAGLEPARVTPLPPQSSVSANSTISANMIPSRIFGRPDISQIVISSGLTVKGSPSGKTAAGYSLAESRR
jgi:hypothetical protein